MHVYVGVQLHFFYIFRAQLPRPTPSTPTVMRHPLCDEYICGFDPSTGSSASYHHHFPDPAAPQPQPANPDGENRGEATASARPAHLDINEVD